MRALCVLGWTLSGCLESGQFSYSSLDFEIYTAVEQESLLSGSEADLIELVIVDISDPFGDQIIAELSIADGEGSLPRLPVGSGFQIFVRGFQGDDATPQFYGASLPFVVAAGVAGVSIQVGRADCLGLNQSSRLRSPEGKDDMVMLRVGMSMSALPDGRVLLIGGGETDGQGHLTTIHDTMEIYDPNRGQFTLLSARLRTPRAFHSATVLESGQVLVVGGITAATGVQVSVSASASIIDVHEPGNVVQALPDAFEAGAARYGHQAIRLSDARRTVLITGGQDEGGAALASTYRFFPSEAGDPANGRFVRQGDLRSGRYGHASAPLSRTSELAVVGGGVDQDDAVSDAIEIFTVNTEQGGCTEPTQVPGDDVGCFIRPNRRRLAAPRWGHQAIAVDQGRQVLFVGGFGDLDRGAPPTALELLDERLEMRSGVGDLEVGRGDLSATLLSDESVLLLGGRRGNLPMDVSTRLQPRRAPDKDGDQVIQGYRVVELDPDCEMSEPLFAQQAVRMASGTVLVTGGITSVANAASPSRRAQIYFPRVVDLGTVYPR